MAVINDAAYEWCVSSPSIIDPTRTYNAFFIRIQHEGPGRKAGLSTEQLLEVRMTPTFGPPNHKSTLTPALSAALTFADYMTSKVHVPDDIFAAMKKHLDDRQIVEASATVGFYNFVSRFLVTLNVDGKMSTRVPIPL